MHTSSSDRFPRRSSFSRVQSSSSIGLPEIAGSASATAGGTGSASAFSHLARSVTKESPLRLIRRSPCVAFFGLLVLALLVTTVATVLDSHRGNNGARRYEQLMSELEIAAQSCVCVVLLFSCTACVEVVGSILA